MAIGACVRGKEGLPGAASCATVAMGQGTKRRHGGKCGHLTKVQL